MEIQSEGQDLHLIKVVQRLTGSKCFFVIIVYQGHSRRLYEYFLCSVKKRPHSILMTNVQMWTNFYSASSKNLKTFSKNLGFSSPAFHTLTSNSNNGDICYGKRLP